MLTQHHQFSNLSNNFTKQCFIASMERSDGKPVGRVNVGAPRIRRRVIESKIKGNNTILTHVCNGELQELASWPGYMNSWYSIIFNYIIQLLDGFHG